MTDITPASPPIHPIVEDVITEMNRAAEAEYVQVTVSRVTPKISAKAREIIYTIGVVAGTLGAIAPAIVALTTGDAQIAIASIGALALAITNLLARLNLSKTADDLAKEAAKE